MARGVRGLGAGERETSEATAVRAGGYRDRVLAVEDGLGAGLLGEIAGPGGVHRVLVAVRTVDLLEAAAALAGGAHDVSNSKRVLEEYELVGWCHRAEGMVLPAVAPLIVKVHRGELGLIRGGPHLGPDA